MINFLDYGLTEKNINMDYYNKLTEKGKEVHCEELAKAKTRATHIITFLNTRGEEKETYWWADEDQLENAVTLFRNNKCEVLAIAKKA